VNFTARVTSRASKATSSLFRQARIAALGLASVALTALFLVPTSVPAAATPPVTVAEAKALVTQLRTDAVPLTSSTRVSSNKSSRAGHNFA
jgi:hypothetical protein